MARAVKERILKLYSDKNGYEPFTEWLASVKDVKTKARIYSRLDRVALGNFGDCDSVGEGVYELRLFFGAGYRIYFAGVDDVIVLLLCGGDKKTQKRDIKTAKEYWKDYQETVI